MIWVRAVKSNDKLISVDISFNMLSLLEVQTVESCCRSYRLEQKERELPIIKESLICASNVKEELDQLRKETIKGEK